jgi:hypothetical protein
MLKILSFSVDVMKGRRRGLVGVLALIAVAAALFTAVFISCEYWEEPVADNSYTFDAGETVGGLSVAGNNSLLSVVTPEEQAESTPFPVE